LPMMYQLTPSVTQYTAKTVLYSLFSLERGWQGSDAMKQSHSLYKICTYLPLQLSF
jgi:hypothetical protein